jgi:chorismate mutase
MVQLFQRNITHELEAWHNFTVQNQQVTFKLECCIRHILGTDDELYVEEKLQKRIMCYLCNSKRKGKLCTYVNMQKTCVLDSALKLNGKQTVTTLDVQEICYFKDLQYCQIYFGIDVASIS